ncbi:MAG: TolC family protein [Bacteroidota bacterium]|nr:TolC family protein [Bacteroidota bacterium]
MKFKTVGRSGMIKVICTIFLLLVSVFKTSAQDSLSLEECISYAWQNNTQIQRNALQVEQAGYNVTQNKASYIPSLNGSATNIYNFGRTIDPTTNQFSNQRIRTNYLSLNSDVLLFNSGQTHYMVKSAQENENVFLYNLAITKQDVALNVANFFLQVLMLEEREMQVRNQLINSKSAATHSRTLVKAGAAAPSRELEAIAQVAGDSALLIDIQTQVLQAYLNLKQFMNYDPLKPLVLKKITGTDVITQYTDADLQRALAQVPERPEVQSANSQIIRAEYDWKAARSNRFPKLYGSASLNTGYSSGARNIDGYVLQGYEPVGALANDTTQVVIAPFYLPLLISTPFGDQINNNFGQSVGLRLSVPIFNGFQNAYIIQVNDIGIRNAELTKTDAENAVKNDIIQSFEGMKRAKLNYDAQIARLRAQEALFQNVNISYAQGAAGYFEWYTASNNLSIAQSEMLQAKYTYIFQTKVFETYLNPPQF